MAEAWGASGGDAEMSWERGARRTYEAGVAAADGSRMLIIQDDELKRELDLSGSGDGKRVPREERRNAKNKARDESGPVRCRQQHKQKQKNTRGAKATAEWRGRKERKARSAREEKDEAIDREERLAKYVHGR